MRGLLPLLLVACTKPAPPPAVDAAPAAPLVPAPPPAPAPAPAPAAACDLTVEAKTADVTVVRGWREAHRRAAGFEEEQPGSEDDAKKTLCRMDACADAPPWYVTARITPHASPANLVVPLEGNKLAVVRLGVMGIAFCDDAKTNKNGAVNRAPGERSFVDGIILYEEEITPACDDNAPTEHRWHAVDPKTKREVVLRGKDLRVQVHGRTIGIESPACHETRSLDP